MVSAHNYVHNFDFCPVNLEPIVRQGLPIYTLVFQELILSILTSRDNTLSLTFWLPAVNPTKMYKFYNLFLSFWLDLLQLRTQPQKFRQTPNMGKDTFLLGHVAIFLYIITLHEILSPHTFYNLQDAFNI